MEIKDLLEKMSELQASDLYLTTGAPPTAKVNGQFVVLDNIPFPKGEVKRLAYGIMDPNQREVFELRLEMNLAYILPENRRFRVNIFLQQAEVGMVIRRIHTVMPTIETLNLPTLLKDLAMEKRGLILFVGATGCGKSTSLAALIDYRNTMTPGHIITIEDPIEFVHKHNKSIVNQREIGLDTISYNVALANALRQSPDVILIGEIRTRETMEQAMAFAETGHLCLSTLHTNNANQAFDRIVNMFPKEYHSQLLLDLSLNMKAVIAQRLINNKYGTRSIAVEILINTPLIASLIQRGEFDVIKEAMEKSTNLGMQTFDQELERLYLAGKITLEEALRNADSKNNLRLKISLKDKSVSPSAPSDMLEHNKKVKNPFGKEDKSGLHLIDDEDK